MSERSWASPVCDGQGGRLQGAGHPVGRLGIGPFMADTVTFATRVRTSI